MKYLLVGIIMLLVSLGLKGQRSNEEETEKKTLLSDKPLTGGAISFTGKGGEISNQEALWLGGEVFTVFDHNLHLGVAGYGLVNTIKSINTDVDEKQLHLQCGYGGLFIEPAILENKLVNISFPVLLGAGGIGETRVSGFVDDLSGIDDFELEGDDFYNSDFFWIIEPGVGVNLNISQWMKLSAGVSYRYAYDLELPQTSSTLLDGFNGNVSLKLGWF
ncbi:MAG: hypothetical protein AB8B53_00485 [Flavobacteriales bacterium]